MEVALGTYGWGVLTPPIGTVQGLRKHGYSFIVSEMR